MKHIHRILSGLIFVLVGIAAIVFLLRNNEPVAVDFVLFEFSAGISTWMILAFVIGGICGLLAGTGMLLRLGKAKVQAARQAKNYEKEVNKLRSAAYKE